ncbi:hypothetical protein [Legionella sp. WA2022007384]
MLKMYMRQGINFKRTQETLNAGTEVIEKAGKDSTLDIVQQTKKNVENIISEHKEIHAASSLWADNQMNVMQELRESRGDDAQLEEETAFTLSF